MAKSIIILTFMYFILIFLLSTLAFWLYNMKYVYNCNSSRWGFKTFFFIITAFARVHTTNNWDQNWIKSLFLSFSRDPSTNFWNYPSFHEICCLVWPGQSSFWFKIDKLFILPKKSHFASFSKYLVNKQQISWQKCVA